MKYPIYVASKGRPRKCKTARLLKEAGLDFFLVLDSQDEALLYDEAGVSGTRIVLQEKDLGMGYVRASAMQHARHSNNPYYWFLDDDLLSFAFLMPPEANNGKHLSTIKIQRALEALEDGHSILLEELEESELLLMYGPGWIQSARGWDKRPFRFDRMPSIVALMHSNPEVNYRVGFKVRDDIAFFLDNMFHWNNNRTVMSRHILFRASEMGGADSGGSRTWYRQKLDFAECHALEKEYPMIIDDVHHSGKGDARMKMDWRLFDEERGHR